MYDTNKKCPITGKPYPMGGRAYTECNETSCRFQANQRCMIIENHETLARLEDKIDAIQKALRLQV